MKFFSNWDYFSRETTWLSSIPQIFLSNKIDICKAWSGNTINTVIFRHHGLLTIEDFQYTAFYLDESTLRIVKRDLVSNTHVWHDIKGKFILQDAHNSISMGHDENNILHLAYNLHATNLQYRCSLRPCDISSWTNELSMTGKYEKKVTYPSFICLKDRSLLLLYRDGIHNKGAARIKKF